MPFYRARVWSRFQETPLTEVMLDDAIRRLAALALDQMGNVNRESFVRVAYHQSRHSRQARYSSRFISYPYQVILLVISYVLCFESTQKFRETGRMFQDMVCAATNLRASWPASNVLAAGAPQKVQNVLVYFRMAE